MGLEPTTFCMQSRCSSQLSYVPGLVHSARTAPRPGRQLAQRNVWRYASGDVPTTRAKCWRSVAADPKPHRVATTSIEQVRALEQPLRQHHPLREQPLQRRRAGRQLEPAGERARRHAGAAGQVVDTELDVEVLHRPVERAGEVVVVALLGHRATARTAPGRRRGGPGSPCAGRRRWPLRRRGPCARSAGTDRWRPPSRPTSTPGRRRRRARRGRRRCPGTGTRSRRRTSSAWWPGRRRAARRRPARRPRSTATRSARPGGGPAAAPRTPRAAAGPSSATASPAG